jgi:hypothetical protein
MGDEWWVMGASKHRDSTASVHVTNTLPITHSPLRFLVPRWIRAEPNRSPVTHSLLITVLFITIDNVLPNQITFELQISTLILTQQIAIDIVNGSVPTCRISVKYCDKDDFEQSF